jgi:DNA-binding transcriptional LysR family regulator
MTLDQLRIFLEVAKHEHVTKAAHALNMTQSAVSSAIALLEARHSVTLFNRVGRRIELTHAGRLFMAEARTVIHRAEQAERFLADLGGAASGILRLYASQTMASYWLPPHLVRYRELYPRVEIKLHLGNTTTVAAAVLEGKADLGLVEGKVETGELIHEVVAKDRIVVIVSKQHPWADGRPISVSDLRTTTWVMREPGSGTRSEFEANLRALGVDPSTLPTALEMPSNEACLAAVEVGRSATVLSKRAVFPRMAQGNFHEVNLDLPVRNFSILRHSERHAPKSVRAMIEMLRSPDSRDEIV